MMLPIHNGHLSLLKALFYKGTLEEGSIVKFFRSEKIMVCTAVLKKNIPNKEIKFLHLGEIYDGVEKSTKLGRSN